MSLRLVNGKFVDADGNDTEPVLEEVSPQTEAINDNPEGYPVCDGCGAVNYEWTPGQRGRKPRYHKDCRPVAPNRRSASSGVRNEAALRSALENRYLSLARIFSLRHPAYGDSVRNNIERAVEADLAYARVNPGFRKMLESSLDKTALAEVLAIHVSMFAPIVVGESVRRNQAKTMRGGSRAEAQPPRKQASPPRTTEQAPPQSPKPENVHPIRDDMFPGDTEGPTEPETVNAGAMPGMPG